MGQQDDPEERIRQLEQSAASYGAVELGGQQNSGGSGYTPTSQLPPPPNYGNPPPPGYGTPPSYGNPYQPPFGTHYTPIEKKGAPVGLIVGLLAVVLIIVGGGIAAFVWNVSSTVEEVAGGGGRVDRPGDGPTYSPPSIVIPSIPKIPGIPGGGADETATPGGQLSVSGIDETKTVACNEANISVSGVNNTVDADGTLPERHRVRRREQSHHRQRGHHRRFGLRQQHHLPLRRSEGRRQRLEYGLARLSVFRRQR